GEVSAEEMVTRLIGQLGLQVTNPEVATALDAEVGAVMRELRSIGGHDLDSGSLDVLETEPAHEAFRRELHAVQAGADARLERLGLVLLGTIRHAPDAGHAAESIRVIGYHLRTAAAAGDVATAGALAQRLATLVQPGLFQGWTLAQPVSVSMGTLLDDVMARAIADGTHRNPDLEAWRGLLFSLGQLAAPSQLDAILRLGRPLQDRGMLQALGDAMLLVAERGQSDLRDVLSRASEADLAVVLLALGRRPDPTLVELILAREGSPDPQVREAVLIALRAHQSPRIKEVMRRALDDPAASVRMEALRYLSVYRDAAAGEKVEARLSGVGERDADEAELRALAIASAIMTRGEGLSRLEDIATGVVRCKHPQAPRAALHGLRAGGGAGREALERIGRSQPALRDEIRALLGGTR
ncbi:MAG: HEAT repeat domain-containing protein, partial [Myxococcota bacterium]|nr:HEAT repeat domain-containing protein [Myxococcota bacterium]